MEVDWTCFVPGTAPSLISGTIRTILPPFRTIRYAQYMKTGTEEYGWVPRNGLNLLLEDESSFRRLLNDPDKKKVRLHNFIYSAIYQDEDDNLWVGTYGGGLCKMDPETGAFISLSSRSGRPEYPLR